MIAFNVRKNMTLIEYIICFVKFFLQPIEDIRSYRKSFKNYFHVIKRKRRNNFPIDVTLHDGTRHSIISIEELRLTRFALEKSWDFENELLIIKKENFPDVKLCDWRDNGDIAAIFFENQYDFLVVKDKVVVDIGANIGDTSIYFALRGAKKVIAIEPLPLNYESAKKNIQLNELRSKIDLQLAGCSNKIGYIEIDSEKSGMFYFAESEKDSSVRIPLVTLDNICKKYDIHSGILKIDCEGCEYEVILSTSDETLRRFNGIQIEYHFGYKNLKRKLEKTGFKVIVTKPKIGRIHYKDQPRSFFGYIYATQKETT